MRALELFRLWRMSVAPGMALVAVIVAMRMIVAVMIMRVPVIVVMVMMAVVLSPAKRCFEPA